MSTKLSWTRLNAGEWMNEVSCLSPAEKCIYVMLRFQMLYTGEPLLNDLKALALYVGYPVKTFTKVLELLLLKKKIVRLEDGSLWNLDVEAELGDSKAKSEAASKAASARWEKAKNKSDNDYLKENDRAYNPHMRTECDAHSECNANNINTNSYNKKTKTIVLAKKEIDFEDSEAVLPLHESNGSDGFNALPVQNEDASNCSEITDAVKSSPTHEQENIPKKVKRSRADRGCRLPDDFDPDYEFAILEGLSLERVNIETAKFRDYWSAKTGKDATKRDWQATWRNWIRNSKNYGNNKIGNNHGNYPQQQKSIGERIADCVLDIGNRGYFKAHS
ncbi:hypothetical protein [Bartonella sp. cb54]|uniref:hypothetical protein n=1 Tax=Bartonella sp. cb54 TaxID=3385560 RepID=UPI0039A5D54F